MLNKCTFIGRLGRDPETKYAASGTAVTNFSIAVSETWKDKSTGEKREKTEWINCVAFGRTAEICGEYLVKGKQVYIEGKMQTDSYEKDGVTRYSTKINVSPFGGMIMLGGGQQRDEQGHPPGDHDQRPEPPDDDIPF